MSGIMIASMRGLRGAADTSAVIPENLFFDFSKYAEGELQLLFLREKAKLLKVMYPESTFQNQWERSINRIDNAVYHGLTNFSFTGAWSVDENAVAKAISFLKNKTAPANGSFITNRRNPSVGGADLIPLEDSYEQCKIFLNNSYGQSYGSCVAGVDAANAMKQILNDPDKGLEKSSHQFLYNWVTDADLNNETLTFDSRFKMARHKEHLFELERVTRLSSMNLAGWLSLGVMRQNALKLTEAMTPQETIAYLKANLDVPILERGDSQADGVGEPFTLIAIAVLILASFIGITGLVQVCKGQEPTAFKYIRDLGSLAAATNSPGGIDFKPKTTGGGGTGGGDNLTPEQKCALKTGYKWNAAKQVCEKIDTGSGAGKGTGLAIDFSDPLVIGTGVAVVGAGLYLATR
jgi:hypothetical protein